MNRRDIIALWVVLLGRVERCSVCLYLSPVLQVELIGHKVFRRVEREPSQNVLRPDKGPRVRQ